MDKIKISSVMFHSYYQVMITFETQSNQNMNILFSQIKTLQLQPRGSPVISSVRSINLEQLSTESWQKFQIENSFKTFYVTSEATEDIHRPNPPNQNIRQTGHSQHEVAILIF